MLDSDVIAGCEKDQRRPALTIHLLGGNVQVSRWISTKGKDIEAKDVRGSNLFLHLKKCLYKSC